MTLNRFDSVSKNSYILHFFPLARTSSVYCTYGDALTYTPHNYVGECTHHHNCICWLNFHLPYWHPTIQFKRNLLLNDFKLRQWFPVNASTMFWVSHHTALSHVANVSKEWAASIFRIKIKRGKQMFWLNEVLIPWMGQKGANAQSLHTDLDNGGRLLWNTSNITHW